MAWQKTFLRLIPMFYFSFCSCFNNRLNEWKDNVESKGRRVNVNKTKVMTSGEHQNVRPCGVCSKGVSSNSLQCTSCQKWINHQTDSVLPSHMTSPPFDQ